MVEHGNRPTCPACGDGDKQVLLGQLWDRPQIVYHCRACESLYLADAPAQARWMSLLSNPEEPPPE
jgi:hypothetical protein